MTELRCHPQTPCPPLQVRAQVVRRDTLIQASFVLSGTVSRLRIPPARVPRFSEGLWRHTCCEMFIARPGSPAYHELNFSPSGEWALYGFSDYRNGGPLGEPVPVTRTEVGDRALRLEAQVAWPPGKLLIALSAVVESADGALSYWALRHAPGKPDFHHRDAFALELA